MTDGIADITYLRTPTGFVYLAVVLDAWSRRVVGWALRERIDTALIAEALEQAVLTRRPQPALLHHSDRGVQYASQEYVRLLSRHGMIGSMSRIANPYDNAHCESFFKTLKSEQAEHRTLAELPEWQQRLSVYIDYYNQERLHSALDYQSPAAFEGASVTGRPEAPAREFCQA